MVSVKYVPSDMLINYVSGKLKEEKKIKEPNWVKFVKTGVSKEKPPLQDDWIYVRAASMLRKLYINGYLGISRMSSEYGGKVDRGSKRYHAASGSRSITRFLFHELESAGLVQKTQKGRSLSPQGMSLLDNASKEIIKQLAQKDPLYEKFI
ncbi:ribosomal protein small subunit S19 [Thermoplasma volcanium GSS1]|uniref:Small ribosomal subunit protein eS19 n=1 Tax=Thermoplasma volcanium (strain ATCC 51530 / DSM 4299 / JCM 9571 / NBRC 15438 / GSS1) TaxID=273116 RepID=RS19E_THEVO|nr:30S ribosomal protein S19e [Thermoplasma volcanium]Q97CU4.1 RecName: Full=Small ribosomal subunit protein eS19; AltName: Full=30S ribosomal protein S19e [Thermoplasma volcanium GSS1]BAB59149.1 ribosomal protein small subunit S19 [Thermoplasma volcanium GSS1]